ncbi:MAG: AAA domain-containing protein [Ruminococcus sp.]
MTFREASIIGSEQYYNYLSKHGKGFIEYNVIKVTSNNPFYYLKTGKTIRNFPDLSLKIGKNIYENSYFKIIEYNEESNEITLSPQKELKKVLENIKPTEISFVYDLKFLVNRVKHFYEKYGYLIKFPTHSSSISYHNSQNLRDNPSEEQLCAIEGVLSTPFSYVWGAPGTGKTKFVLARCVLSHLAEQSSTKIIITAPTNNAVEQTLYGILPVIAEYGIDIKKVLRLGTPSKKFLNMYHNCCEYGEAEKEGKRLTEKIQLVEMSIKSHENNIKLYDELEKAKIFLENFEDCKIRMESIFNILSRQHTIYNEINQKIIVNKGRINYSKIQIEKFNVELTKLENNINYCNKVVESLSKGIRKNFFKHKYEKYNNLLKENLDSFETNKNKINAHKISCKKLEKENIELHVKLNDSKKTFMDALQSAKKYTKFWNKFYNIILGIRFDNYNDEPMETFNKMVIKGEEQFVKRMERYSEIIDISKEEYLERVSELYLEKNKLNELLAKITPNLTSKRIKECRVLATTIDTLINRIVPDNDFKPSHIYLDEAGYCPLIKGATLLAYDCPVTLLGDHMQLPPVCVMSDDEIDYNKFVSFYAQSSLYLEDIALSPDIIVNNYRQRVPPKFDILLNFTLNHTYRFGEALASVLAKSVYSPQFHGSQNFETEIYYIDCPKMDNPKDRFSSSEINNIVKYIYSHQNEDIGIITPYNNQVQAINKALNNRYEAMTVHRSQGNEWDTVLLSIVDTTNKWFTNSQSPKSNGKNIINTAVSRAKRKLIIFCDSDYWKTQQKQLIGQILSVANEMSIE